MAIKGQIIGGSYDTLLLRQKSGETLEIGELLIGEYQDFKVLFQVTDLKYSSQISQSNIEHISGLQIEEQTDFEIIDKHLRYYTIAEIKGLLSLSKASVTSHKKLPEFFSTLREITGNDITFMNIPKDPFYCGHLRSGSLVFPTDLFIDGREVLSHHVLLAATTGRGKSNLTSCILWQLLEHHYAGVLVLDPHDEYFGRNGYGLKDHPNQDLLEYYTSSQVPPGGKTLKFNLSQLRPNHLRGAIYLTDAQQDAIYTYYKTFGNSWAIAILQGKEIRVGSSEKLLVNEATLTVLRRKFMSLFNVSVQEDTLTCHGIFDDVAGESTIQDICASLELGKTVIIDTSSFGGSVEILIGSLLTHDIFNTYKRYKQEGILSEKPVISIVLEEAPRVLGKEVLEQGPNIFQSIAKEGRKFNIGLFAITQLPSLIPRQILANMNTKIVLGIEMSSERQSIIDSAAQDLSAYSRAIATLDKGEAIITSNFTKFALPVKFPFFPDLIKKEQTQTKKDFSGIGFS